MSAESPDDRNFDPDDSSGDNPFLFHLGVAITLVLIVASVAVITWVSFSLY